MCIKTAINARLKKNNREIKESNRLTALAVGGGGVGNVIIPCK